MNNKPRKLLILGSLDEFIQLTCMAHAQGIYTIVCDGYPDGPAKKYCDQSYDIDVREIDTIADLCKREKVDHIITSFSDLLFECMVKIAAKAGLPCYIQPDQLLVYRDKSAMKQLMDHLNIPTAKHIRLTSGFSDEALADFHFPVVTKPLDMYGSRGLFILESAAEVRSYFERACASSDIKEILVEEYNTGYEFNMMTWVLNGTVHVLSIADREKSPSAAKDIPYSSRNVYPSRLIDHVYEEARQILTTFISETGQKEGPLSMQFFWTPDQGIQVCEIAGRFLGYEHELVEYNSQLSIEQLLLDSLYNRAALQAALANHTPFMTKHSAVLYFQCRDGIIADQSTAEAIAAWPFVVKMQLFYQNGEHVTPHGPQPYAARCYIIGQTRAEIDTLTQKILDTISIKDFEGNELLLQNKLTRYITSDF